MTAPQPDWCPKCGRVTFREQFDGRRQPRRCAGCGLVVGHCKCERWIATAADAGDREPGMTIGELMAASPVLQGAGDREPRDFRWTNIPDAIRDILSVTPENTTAGQAMHAFGRALLGLVARSAGDEEG